MKVIFKINEYYSDTRQISVSMCKSTSIKSIDEHKKTIIDLDQLSYYDSDSFVRALVDRSADTRIKEDNALETVLSSNVGVTTTGDLNIQNLVGKVIDADTSGESYVSSKSNLVVRRLELWYQVLSNI